MKLKILFVKRFLFDVYYSSSIPCSARCINVVVFTMNCINESFSMSLFINNVILRRTASKKSAVP